MKIMAALLIAIVGALNGCAAPPSTHVQLTIFSEPSGAKISSEGVAEGFAPFFAYYDKALFDNKKLIDKAGCLVVKPFVATWPSGHSVKSADKVTLCSGRDSSYTLILKRDPNAPGKEIDYKFSAEFDLHKMRVQAANDLAEQRRIDAMWDAISAGVASANKPAPYSPPSTYNCTTKKGFGGAVTTNCNSY